MDGRLTDGPRPQVKRQKTGSVPINLVLYIVKPARHTPSGAMERRTWRRAGYRYGNGNGGRCGCWNVGRNGRCFGAGDRRCYGRRSKGRSDSYCETRTGCRSGLMSSSRSGCCSGSMNGCRCDTRSWDRNGACCSGRNGCYTRRCAGRRNEGRLGGRNSPSGLGDREDRIIQKPEFRDQKAELSEREGVGARP